MSARTRRDTSVESAMSRVLAAERDAHDRVRECERQAEQLLADARETVRAMVSRTRERISRLHARGAETTAARIAEMERSAANGAYCPLPSDEEQTALQRAVSIVAARITTPDNGNAR